MKYIGVKEAAKRWGISDRRVRLMCTESRIEGAIKLEWSWAIPASTPKPRDGRQIRHIKNHHLRLGFMDLDALESGKSAHPVSLDALFGEYLSSVIEQDLAYALLDADIAYDKASIHAVLSGQLVMKLSLEKHLLYTNFKAAFHSLGSLCHEFEDPSLKSVHRILTQGILHDDEYRKGFSETALAGKDHIRVDVQMEALFSQYEMEWKNLHPISRAILIYGEVLRIKPYEQYNELLAMLLLCGIMISGGYYPVCFEPSMLSEVRASLSLSRRRGNYQDFSAIVERRLLQEYREA